MRRITAVLLVACSVSSQSSNLFADVEIKSGDHQLQVHVDGKPFATYQFAPDLPKPFFSPVRSADGTVLTRAIDNPKDHPHHKGVWVSVDEVNDVKFWAEKGRIANHDVKVVTPRGNPAVFHVTNHWLGQDGQPIVREVTRISIFANRLMAYDIEFHAINGLVRFEDTKEGLFGFRMVDELRESETGRVVNADGKQGTAQCWGKTSAWVDYSGTVNGNAVGVALFDHPLNFRPSRYHVRNYGLFSISPFGERAYTGGQRPADPLILLKGTTVRLRYGLYVHDGDVKTGQVAAAYVDYLRDSGK